MKRVTRLLDEAGVAANADLLLPHVAVVSDDQVARFLSETPTDGRSAIAFKTVGDTVLVESRKWSNVVYSFRQHIVSLAGAAGLGLASLTSEGMPAQVGNATLAALALWRSMVDARGVELDERHAVLVHFACLMGRSGQVGGALIESPLRELYASKGWDFDRTVGELRELRVIHGSLEPFEISLRERVLTLRPRFAEHLNSRPG